MTESVKKQKDNKLGEPGYINQNCWLASNLGYPPSEHCRYCEIKLKDCVFSKYLIISSVLASVLFILSFLVDGSISKILIISVFTLIIVYGYYFDKSTQKIIIASFEEKKAKKSFEELNKDLQHRVDTQTKEIMRAYDVEKKAKESLQKIDQQKNEFMMITQHHLRTPLTSMMGYVSLLQQGAYGKVPKKINEILERFGISTTRLIEMVNDFLDLSHYELGKPVIKLETNIDAKEIIGDVIKELHIEADKKGLTLEIDEPKEQIPKIQADSNRLRAVFTNIIDNAIKYTDKGGIFVQMATKTDNSGQNLEITIKDTGIGMDKDEINNLFLNLFTRGEDAKYANVSGKGIGMYLSAKIIGSHNGKIWAESEGKNKGSAFHIELPVV